MQRFPHLLFPSYIRVTETALEVDFSRLPAVMTRPQEPWLIGKIRPEALGSRPAEPAAGPPLQP